MENLIFNNGSVKIGYNDVPWTFSTSTEDVFMHKCDPTTRPVQSFRLEAIQAAKEIRAAFPGKTLYAMYSGGVDSEAMLEAFRLADVRVTVVLLEFTDGSNQHDLVWARKYLNRVRFSGDVKVIPFDIKSWIRSNECLDMARDMQTLELILTHLFKVASDHLRDGIVMTGHEEPSLWIEPGIGWVWNKHEVHYGMHKYFIKEGLSGIPSFFQWSTELLAAFIFNKNYTPAYYGLLNKKIWSAEQLKYGFYGDQFGLEARTKYTGFEHMLSDIIRANDAWAASAPAKWDREINSELQAWSREVNYVKAA